MDYTKELKTLDENIFSKMRICSFDLDCDEYNIDFEDAGKHELYTLLKDKESVSSYFSIIGSSKNILKIYLPKKRYDAQVLKVQQSFILKFAVVVLVVLTLSLLFSFYTLSPLRKALSLTEEFIKDILHDFNTPLATLRLNTSMLEVELGTNKKLKRIQNSVQTILSLQSNLRAYLQNHEAQIESFSLNALIKERVTVIESNHPTLTYKVEIPEYNLKTNKEAFTRVIDNLVSNASKYNKQNGSVDFILEDDILKIKDTGKGIQNPDKVFDRFYKEQDRGIGIGLHIVKKLCNALDIAIHVESKIEAGTSFSLNLKNIHIS